MDLVIATHNAHKTREFRQLLGHAARVTDLAGRDAPIVQETGRTFAENAILKAVTVSRFLAGKSAGDGALVAADDSGLEVDRLDGAPGVFSARYAGENATDRNRLEKLLREMEHIEDRSARFRCVIALARDGALITTFDGVVEGEIVQSPRGAGGFGYDPVFVPEGHERTFAEMADAEKNAISHRAEAARKLAVFLKSTAAD